MSRIAKNPIALPKNVEAIIDGVVVTMKGTKGTLTSNIHPKVVVEITKEQIQVEYNRENKEINKLAGTTRAILQNMVTGVSVGYEKKLSLVGVGYRAQVKDSNLSLSLGFSHPVEFPVPTGITIETPSQTEIVIKGCDKQIVGQIAANIRMYRPPEPYKGKGIRYVGEEIVRKEAKKK